MSNHPVSFVGCILGEYKNYSQKSEEHIRLHSTPLQRDAPFLDAWFRTQHCSALETHTRWHTTVLTRLEHNEMLAWVQAGALLIVTLKCVHAVWVTLCSSVNRQPHANTLCELHNSDRQLWVCRDSIYVCSQCCNKIFLIEKSINYLACKMSENDEKCKKSQIPRVQTDA